MRIYPNPGGCLACRKRTTTTLSLVMSTVLVVAWLLVSAPAAIAQDPFELVPAGPNNVSDDAFNDGSRPLAPLSGSGSLSATPRTETSGFMGRVGHIAFPTFGRDGSISHVEILPYVRGDNDVLFGDLRMYLTNGGDLGGNAGFGYRTLHEGLDVVFGGSLWYDGDQSTGELFHQVGASLEALAVNFGARANVYVPVGDKSQAFRTRVVNSRFIGTSLLFDVLRPVGDAMTGVDLELEALVPGDWSREHDLRVRLGGYFFNDDSAPSIVGVRYGAEVNLNEHITTHTELTYDDTFGTNAILGIAFNLPGGRMLRSGRRAADRLTEFSRRNYNVIVARHTLVDAGIVASDPTSGLALQFGHVNSAAGGPGTGTDLDPFLTIADAQLAGADVIFVHADSVLGESVVLAAGQRLIGETDGATIEVADHGSILLPRATGGMSLPSLTGSPGDAVTLGEGSLLSNFLITGAGGHGVVIGALASASVHNVEITGTTGDGLRIDGATGSVLLSDLTIEDAGGVGLRILNTSGSVSATGVTRVDDAIDSGVQIDNLSGDVHFEELEIVSTTGGAGLELLSSTGETSIDLLEVVTDGGNGVQALTGGLLSIFDGEIFSDNAAAVDIEDTEVAINLKRVFSDGGAVGIRLVDVAGTFIIRGSQTLGAGGLIENKTTAMILENVETFLINAMDFDANGTVLQSEGNELIWMSGLRVTNTTGVAIDSLNDESLQLSSSRFEDNGGPGDPLIRFQADTVGDYGLLMFGNTFLHDAGNVVDVATLAGGEGSELNLRAVQNLFMHDATGSDGLNVNWDGAIQASINQNDFFGAGGMSRGVAFTLPSTTENASILIDRNEFGYSGGDDTAMHIVADASTLIAVTQNIVEFAGADSIGFRADLQDDASVSLVSNLILNNVGGGTGFLFDHIDDGSQVLIENNQIWFPTNLLIERGIVFSTVSGTIQLFGSGNNRVVEASQAFFIPAASSTGAIRVNNVFVP